MVPRIVGLRFTAALIACLTLSFLPAAGLAQQGGNLTGQIVDATNAAPINGAQVSVEGTSRGGLTQGNGRYLLTSIPAGTYTVRVTYIGYKTATQEVTISAGQTTTADFNMEVSAVSLDEVVVTGTAGATPRRKLGNAIGSVNLENVQENVPIDGFGQALEARIPGVRSVGVVGGVGAGRELRIRGTSSFSLNQRPVVYIDGIRVDTNQGEWGSMAGATCCAFSGGAGEDRLSDLNPEEIERIEVLKGAAAATLYGSEASGGVIQIFTKKGRSNSAPRFTFGTTVGFNRQRANFPTTLYPNFTGPDGFRALDANKTLIENGLVNTYDLTATGGGEDVTYFIAAGFDHEEGSVQPNYQKRGNLRMNLNWTANEKWTVGINSAFARNKIWDLQSGNNWMSLLGNATLGNPTTATDDQARTGSRGFRWRTSSRWRPSPLPTVGLADSRSRTRRSRTSPTSSPWGWTTSMIRSRASCPSGTSTCMPGRPVSGISATGRYARSRRTTWGSTTSICSRTSVRSSHSERKASGRSVRPPWPRARSSPAPA